VFSIINKPELQKNNIYNSLRASETMATTTLTETTTPSVAEQQHVYGCIHIETILRKHGDRIRQEYDSIMSVVIQPSSSKTAKVKV
jgi:hypothetical protein